jgi:glycosyltransferase involved in cell wall biosynthesis
MALFGGGVNEPFLASHVRYVVCHGRMMRGNSQLMKLCSPKQLHNRYIKEVYDVEISYLEGPCARMISGCPHENTKLISWIHVAQHTMRDLAYAFRSAREARSCYNRFDRTVCVSQGVREDFCRILDFAKPCSVLYNTVESDKILQGAAEPVPTMQEEGRIRLIAVGSLKPVKGYDRLLRITKGLNTEGYGIHLYILGIGPLQRDLEQYIEEEGLTETVTLLGYDTNPYKYLANCDLFLCASHGEGFSTAATEALIVGTPVCTVEVAGMKELLGEQNEWGMVTENDEGALYQGIKSLLDNPDLLSHYKKQAEIRGKSFCTEPTVKAVEAFLLSL